MYARLIDYVPTPCYTHDVSRVYIYIFRYPWDITRSHDCTDRRRKNFTCRSRHVILTLSLNHPIWSSIRNSFLPFFPSILPLCRHPPSGWIPEMRANERVMDSARGACDRRQNAEMDDNNSRGGVRPLNAPLALPPFYLGPLFLPLLRAPATTQPDLEPETVNLCFCLRLHTLETSVPVVFNIIDRAALRPDLRPFRQFYRITEFIGLAEE